MKVCAFAALLWCTASERDDESFMLQSKQASSVAVDTDEFRPWSLCNTKVDSNLGGHKGTFTSKMGTEDATKSAQRPGEMRFYEVGKVNGKIVDLRLQVDADWEKDHGPYQAFDSTENKRIGCFAQINVKTETDVKINFALVETDTDTILADSHNLKQHFTVVDFDTFNNDKNGKKARIAKEQVWAKDFANVGKTRISEKTTEGEWHVFEAPPLNVADGVRDYTKYTSVDLLPADLVKATLDLTYENTNQWSLVLKAKLEKGKKAAGRNFLFAGETSSCEDGTPVCSCTPVEERQTPTADDKYLKWNLCGEEGAGKDVVYDDGHVMRFPKIAKMHAEDGKFDEDGEMDVDLIVDSIGSYAAYNSSMNGRKGCLGVINLKAPGDATMRFTLVKAGTDEAVPVDDKVMYDFNVFDFDQSKKGLMIEAIGVTEFSRLVAKPDSQEMSGPDEDGVTWLRTLTKAVDNPDTDNVDKLDDLQIASSFSVTYAGRSSWDVRFKAEADGKELEERKGGGRKGGRNFLFSGESCASWRNHDCVCVKK